MCVYVCFTNEGGGARLLACSSVSVHARAVSCRSTLRLSLSHLVSACTSFAPPPFHIRHLHWRLQAEYRIIELPSGREAWKVSFVKKLLDHFKTIGSPVMCGEAPARLNRLPQHSSAGTS